MSVIKGTSPCGFEYEIDEAKPASWAFLKAAKKLQGGDLTGAVELVNILFTEEEQDALLECLAKGGKIVTTEMVMVEVDAIIRQAKEVKKSSPSQMS